MFGARAPFRWKGEASFEGYLASVFKEHRDTARVLERRIDLREDLDEIERGLRQFPCGARGEALLVMHLLAQGWSLAHMTPLEVGFDDPRIRDFRDPPERPYIGHRQMPALTVLKANLAALLIPQVPFHADCSHVLDFLVAVRSGGLVARGDLEVDGPGHDVSRDEARKASLGLPTLRLRDEDLDQPDIDLTCRLIEFCRNHGRKRRRALLRPLRP